MHDLFRSFGNGQRGSIHFLQGMGQLRRMLDDEWFAQRGCLTGIKGGIPLLVFVAKAHHHQISAGHQGARAQGIDAGALVVFPEVTVLGSQDQGASAPATLRARQSVWISPDK